MGQEVVIPDWAKNRPAQAFQVLNPADDNLSDGIGQGYPVISYKGKVWGLRYRGERHTFVRPDDGTPSAYIDVIILGQAKSRSKSFYKKYDQDTSEGDRPICASIDGVNPDPDVADKQSDACALCPRNVWKTDPQTGRKGRECSDYKRIAVLVLPTLTKKMLGQPLMEPCFLRVPPASLNSLANMGDSMAGQGFHYSSYITRITFDPNKSHPEMVFRPQQGLTDKEAPVILKLRQDAQVDRIVNGGFASHTPLIAPVAKLSTGTAQTGLLLENPPQSSTGNGSATTVSATSNLPLSTTASAPPAGANGGASSDGGLLDLTGFGSATSAPTQPQSVQVPIPTPVSDSGAPEASDADMDARIANLIKSTK